MKVRRIVSVFGLAVAVSACVAEEGGPRRGAAPGLARLDDDACHQIEECRKLAQACGDNEECIEALNRIVTDAEGNETTIPAAIIAKYAAAQ